MKNLDLGELRGQLDEIDGQLVRLFEQRHENLRGCGGIQDRDG